MKGTILMNKLMSLFTLPLSEININDIRDFCANKIPEGIRVEYKKDLTKDNILKTITSMANTDGGLILIGVPEEKEEGGSRSIPGKPEGITEKNPQQTITNWCRACLQPTYCPEIQQIPTENGKTLLFIRIDKNLIFNIPIYYTEKGILVRVNEQNRLATLEQIQALFKENEHRKNKYFSDFSDWLTPGKIPNLENFCWCVMGLSLPMKQFNDKRIFDSQQIEQFKRVVEKHEIHRVRTRGQSFDTQMQLRRGKQFVNFYPYYLGNSMPDPTRGIWYSIWFDANGYLLASIGFPYISGISDKIMIEEVCVAFYIILDLFTKVRENDYYRECIRESGECTIFAQINQFPGRFETSWINQELPTQFPQKGSSFGGLHESRVVEYIEPEKLAKEYMSEYLADAGCMHYEKNLSEFDIKQWLSHF